MRKPMPARRACWTQKVKIGAETYYLTCGEKPDGNLGEIFLDANKHGTFARGVLDGLARMASLALQCGASVEDVAGALRHLSFPPQGPVAGSAFVQEAASVTDWVALELLAAYGNLQPADSVGERMVDLTSKGKGF